MAATLEYRSSVFVSKPKEALTPSVRLERLTYSEKTLDLWVKWMNDPAIRQYMFSDLPKDKKIIKTWLEIASTEPSRHYYSILSGEKNIGFINLRVDANPNNTAEIGIVIGEKDHQSKGNGTKALKEILDIAKNDLRLENVRAMIKPFNKKSIALFTKNGFTKDADVTIEGEPFLRFIKPLQKNTHS